MIKYLQYIEETVEHAGRNFPMQKAKNHMVMLDGL